MQHSPPRPAVAPALLVKELRSRAVRRGGPEVEVAGVAVLVVLVPPSLPDWLGRGG